MRSSIRIIFIRKNIFPIYLIISSIIVGLVYSCTEKPQNIKPVKVEFRIAEIEPCDNTDEYSFENTQERYYLHQEVLCGNDDIKSTFVEKTLDHYSVLLEFTQKGTEKWSEITGNNIGKRIGILVNDKLVTAPIIRARIDQGKALITGEFSKQEAQRIAEGIIAK
jgi:preprotein translocase subunit SecD